MKKIINVKEIMLISAILILISTQVFATSSGLVLGNTQISSNEYENAQTPEVENNVNDKNTNNNVNNNSKNNVNNNSKNTKVYNTNNTKDLPQTGIEDYNVGILLIICVASAIFAYKKVNAYKNI